MHWAVLEKPGYLTGVLLNNTYYWTYIIPRYLNLAVHPDTQLTKQERVKMFENVASKPDNSKLVLDFIADKWDIIKAL